MKTEYSLQELGWKPFFQQQLSLDDYDAYIPGRIIGHERAHIDVVTEQGQCSVPITTNLPSVTVGDWLLLSRDNHVDRLLDRQSCFYRKAAGTKVDRQLIASNIDTVFIVTSLNQDFNLNRLERYLALAHEADVRPVIVLTKLDQCDDSEIYTQQLHGLGNLLDYVTVNALDSLTIEKLAPWCKTGSTVAFLGSSGVGKSTLINTLSGARIQSTQGIREDDAKGRHTTTSRSLHLLENGLILIDTPGMRELQLVDVAEGLEETFADITSLAKSCKFSDCQHQTEPGCAVQNALESGELDERRLTNFLKLMREQAFNSATLAERRANDKEFGKLIKSVMKNKKQEKKHNY